MLYLILYDGFMHELDLEKMEHYNTINFPRQTVSISVPDMVLTRTEEGYRGDREKSSKMMLAEVNTNETDIVERRERAAARQSPVPSCLAARSPTGGLSPPVARGAAPPGRNARPSHRVRRQCARSTLR